jgi:hypothetical protein
MQDPPLPHRFVSQWCCGEGQGHAANRIITQSLEVRRRADVMPEKDGLKDIFEAHEHALRTENRRINICRSRGSCLIPGAFKDINENC